MKTKIDRDRLNGLPLARAAKAALIIENVCQDVLAQKGREDAILGLALQLRIHCMAANVPVADAMNISRKMIQTPRHHMPQDMIDVTAHVRDDIDFR